MLNNIVDYLKKVLNEMRKVAWPTRSDLVNSTIIVIIISAAVAVIIFILDFVFSNVLRLIIG